jgi:hypothetical protein
MRHVSPALGWAPIAFLSVLVCGCDASSSGSSPGSDNVAAFKTFLEDVKCGTIDLSGHYDCQQFAGTSCETPANRIIIAEPEFPGTPFPRATAVRLPMVGAVFRAGRATCFAKTWDRASCATPSSFGVLRTRTARPPDPRGQAARTRCPIRRRTFLRGDILLGPVLCLPTLGVSQPEE